MINAEATFLQEENECVVAEILRLHPEWDVKAPPRLSSWHRRGITTDGLTDSQASCLIRCMPEDGMNGFFVALFVKRISRGRNTTMW